MATVSTVPRLRLRILLVLLLSSGLRGAFEFPGPGWASAAANIRVVGEAHLDRYQINPALMNHQSGTNIGFTHRRIFSSLDISGTAVQSVFPLGKRMIAASVERFGDEMYNETQFRMATSWELHPALRAGGVAGYSSVQMEGKVIHRGISFSPAIRVSITEKLYLGSSLEHLICFPGDFPASQRFHLGLSYHVQNMEYLVALEKEGDLDMDLKLALQMLVLEKLTATLGFQESNRTLTCGWRVALGRLSFYYTWMGHPYLPPSHGLGLEMVLP